MWCESQSYCQDPDLQLVTLLNHLKFLQQAFKDVLNDMKLAGGQTQEQHINRQLLALLQSQFTGGLDKQCCLASSPGSRDLSQLGIHELLALVSSCCFVASAAAYSVRSLVCAKMALML